MRKQCVNIKELMDGLEANEESLFIDNKVGVQIYDIRNGVVRFVCNGEMPRDIEPLFKNVIYGEHSIGTCQIMQHKDFVGTLSELVRAGRLWIQQE